jgi:hypothetical protein
MKIIGICRLFKLDFNLAKGVTKYWIGHMPARRQPVLILAFTLTVLATFINCYFIAWGVVRQSGMPSWLIRPLFSYFNKGYKGDNRDMALAIASKNYKRMVSEKVRLVNMVYKSSI